MSLNRMCKMLISFGFSQTDSRVYIYLATKGPAKASTISHNIKMNKQQLYRSLKNLKNKNIIKSNLERPAIFLAVPFEEVLKILIAMKEEQAGRIEEKKDELLSLWNSAIND